MSAGGIGGETTATGRPFVLLVSLVGGKPIAYPFDQPRVLVGRGVDADLRIEHAGVSRWQFLVERGMGSAGEPRFRITPYEATNPTYVNDRPAVEGTIVPGDLIAVADVRVVLERKIDKSKKKAKQDLPASRMILLTAVVGMNPVGLTLVLGAVLWHELKLRATFFTDAVVPPISPLIGVSVPSSFAS